MKYYVTAESVSYVSATIEANSFEEAKAIAEDMDGAEFETGYGYGDWRFVDIENVDTGEYKEWETV